MATDLLNLHLRLLILQHGRPRVIQSLARISNLSEATLENEIEILSKAKIPSKTDKNYISPSQIVSKMQLPAIKEDMIMILAREYENKRFLGELRLVAKFLREHGVNKVPKSRSATLHKVLAILSTESEHALRSLVNDCANSNEQSGFAQLAGALMERPKPDQS